MPGIALSRALEDNTKRKVVLQTKLDKLRSARAASYYPPDYDTSIGSAEKEMEALSKEQLDLLDRLARAQGFTKEFDRHQG